MLRLYYLKMKFVDPVMLYVVIYNRAILEEGPASIFTEFGQYFLKPTYSKT